MVESFPPPDPLETRYRDAAAVRSLCRSMLKSSTNPNAPARRLKGGRTCGDRKLSKGLSTRRVRGEPGMHGIRTLAFTLALLTPSVALAEFYYAVVVGEKRYVGREGRDYRATRAAMTQCINEFDPLLCKEIRLERVGRDWQSVVVGQKGFYASDGDRAYRAERRAMAACQADTTVGSCRQRPNDEALGTGEDPQPQDPLLRLEDLLRR